MPQMGWPSNVKIGSTEAVNFGEPKPCQSAVSHPGPKQQLAAQAEGLAGIVSNATQWLLLNFSKQQPAPTWPHVTVSRSHLCLPVGVQRSQNVPSK